MTKTFCISFYFLLHKTGQSAKNGGYLAAMKIIDRISKHFSRGRRWENPNRAYQLGREPYPDMPDGEVHGLLDLVAPLLAKPAGPTDEAYTKATEQMRLAATCKSLKSRHSWREIAQIVREGQGKSYSHVHLRSLVRKLANDEGVWGFLSKKYLCGPAPMLTARETLEVLWLSTDNAWKNHAKLYKELTWRWKARGKKPRYMPKYGTVHSLIGLIRPGVLDVFEGRLQRYHDKFTITAARYYPYVYHTWQLDEHIVKLWSTHRKTKLRFRPRIIVALDCFSRLITSAKLLDSKSTIKRNLSLIYEAARPKDDPNDIIQGLPENLQTDNEAFFRNRSLHFSLRYLGVTPINIYNNCPQANGRVERFFRTIENEFFEGFRSFVKRKCSRKQLLGDAVPFDLLEKLLSEWLHFYNYERIHSAHGRTPIDVYREQWKEADKRNLTGEELRPKFCLYKTKTVQRYGIKQGAATYNGPVLANLVGLEVHVLTPFLYAIPPSIAIMRSETDQPELVPRHEPSDDSQSEAIRAAGRAQRQLLKEAKSILKSATPPLKTNAPNWADSSAKKTPPKSQKPGNRTTRKPEPTPAPPPQLHVWDPAPVY